MRKCFFFAALLLVSCGDTVVDDIVAPASGQPPPPDVQISDWTMRLAGLPFALNDVTWDGTTFVAVGDAGTVLTSDDGMDWVPRESDTRADLNAVAAYGADIVAVGDEIVLLSTDHGETWTTKYTPLAVRLEAVAVNSSQLVVGGSASNTFHPGFVALSEDRGDTWQRTDSWPYSIFTPTDLIYRDGLFVATIRVVSIHPENRAWVKVSSDGRTWNDIVVRDAGVVLFTLVHDGSRFIAAGSDSTVSASHDGHNWTEIRTPVEGIIYLSAAWSGSSLLLAGAVSTEDCSACSARPAGIASTDGGLSWDVFDIDDNYLSRGLAFGNGRFVSVGQSTPGSGEGAIYTAE